MDIIIPDLVEPITAYRAWRLKDDGEGPRLFSATAGNIAWTPREAMVAVCSKKSKSGKVGVGEPDFDVPHPRCGCGLYAATSLHHLSTMNYHKYADDDFVIVGEVALWGNVVPGSQGYRAQFGYPRKLYVPFEAWRYVKPLQEAYGCPVELDNTLIYEIVE